MCILFIISVITVVLYNSDIKLKILYKKRMNVILLQSIYQVSMKLSGMK